MQGLLLIRHVDGDGEIAKDSADREVGGFERKVECRRLACCCWCWWWPGTFSWYDSHRSVRSLRLNEIQSNMAELVEPRLSPSTAAVRSAISSSLWACRNSLTSKPPPMWWIRFMRSQMEVLTP